MPDTMGDPARTLATRFVEARLDALALPRFPGEAPSDLASAYSVQDAAIEMWPDDVAGWKVGLIQSEQRARFGAERIAGPIFKRQIYAGERGVVDLPLIEGGFGAVEAELVLVVGRTPPPDKMAWSAAEAAAYASAMHVGVEFAGSPFAGINDFGPAVTASDFGNNSGLVLGRAIANWRTTPVETLTAETRLDGVTIGSGSGANVPGGPLAAFAFILENCARRAIGLRPGHLVSTGAITGVHSVRVGQEAYVSFGQWGAVSCRIVAAPQRNARLASA